MNYFKYFCIFFICFPLIFIGCSQTQNPGLNSSGEIAAGAANKFNPFMQTDLPNTRAISSEGASMLKALGGKAQTIETEARHRKNWKSEIYPVIFGDSTAPGEIIAVLDFSEPESEKVWDTVYAVSKSLTPQKCKIVVFGKSQENYGTDLMGMTIWLIHSQPDLAMNWLSYALKRWNSVKAQQKQQGNVKKFTNEYDSVAARGDFPIIYTYLNSLEPRLSSAQELAVSRYSYDAGNVNMYQANQVTNYYDVKKLPAIIVNGKVLKKISEKSILEALQ